MHRLLCFVAILLALASGASAQLNVNIEVKKRTYVRYEPLLVTVTITNLSGRDLVLEDGSSQWFGFTVLQGAGETLIAPRNPDYRLDPLEIKLGESIKRTVNLNQLYPMSELGIHRLRATIYCKEFDKYFTSRTANIDIAEGRTMWKQTVGVPETMKNAGQMHEMSIVKSHGARYEYLYCRVSDPE